MITHILYKIINQNLISDEFIGIIIITIFIVLLMYYCFFIKFSMLSDIINENVRLLLPNYTSYGVFSQKYFFFNFIGI